jgi:hypothetical protein
MPGKARASLGQSRAAADELADIPLAGAILKLITTAGRPLAFRELETALASDGQPLRGADRVRLIATLGGMRANGLIIHAKVDSLPGVHAFGLPAWDQGQAPRADGAGPEQCAADILAALGDVRSPMCVSAIRIALEVRCRPYPLPVICKALESLVMALKVRQVEGAQFALPGMRVPEPPA